jgi:uncharacterized protein YchJ
MGDILFTLHPPSIACLSHLAHRTWEKPWSYTNICFIQHHGESSPHQPGYVGLDGWFHITIEIDKYHEYSRFVRSVSPWFIFLNDICYLDH